MFLERLRTPQWLKTFAYAVYGEQCVRCKSHRPLQVAHLENWPDTRDGDPLALHDPDNVAWLFHQPINVVVLCCNCHCLFDGQEYTDVTLDDIREARDRELMTERAAVAVREYLCRGFSGTVVKNGDNVLNRWFPMLLWLQSAYEAGVLPEPHRFALPEPRKAAMYVNLVDIPQAMITTGSYVDQHLPRWTPKGFVAPPEKSIS